MTKIGWVKHELSVEAIYDWDVEHRPVCLCGWEGLICDTYDRAKSLYHGHLNDVQARAENDTQPPGEVPPDSILYGYSLVATSSVQSRPVQVAGVIFHLLPYGEYQNVYEGMFNDEPHGAYEGEGAGEQETPPKALPHNSDYAI